MLVLFTGLSMFVTALFASAHLFELSAVGGLMAGIILVHATPQIVLRGILLCLLTLIVTAILVTSVWVVVGWVIGFCLVVTLHDAGDR